MWPALETMAPTLAYDSAVMGDETGAGVPADVIARVKVPCLVMGGGASPVWMRTIGKAVADFLPNGRYTVWPGKLTTFRSTRLPLVCRISSPQTRDKSKYTPRLEMVRRDTAVPRKNHLTPI